MPDQGLDEFLAADLGGDTEQSTPDTAQAETHETTEVSSTASAPAEPDNLRALLDAKKQAHPDLADTIDAIHRELQGGFTPKLQEAAELRRKLEGIDDGVLDWARNFRVTHSHSPAAARQMLQDALAEMESYENPSTPVDPYEELGYQSEVERRLAEESRALKGELAEVKQYMIQQQAAALAATADKHFAELAVKFGEIPFEQKRAIEIQRGQLNLPAEMIPVLWKGMFGAELIEKRAIEQAMSGQKQGIGPPPSSLASKPAPVELDPGKMSLDQWLKATASD